MQVNNVKVYDLPEAIVASGFPMLVEYFPNEIASITACVKAYIEDIDRHEDICAIAKPHINRAIKLASAKDGTGHRNFCSGILVAFDLTATNAMWMQFERYHFAQIVSSQSKMHCLKKMTQAESFKFHDKVFENGEELLKNIGLYVDKDSIIDEEELVYNCPMGLELTARVTTNYLQLRTMYTQRKNHKLKEWRDFCDWIETLPMARELIIGEKG